MQTKVENHSINGKKTGLKIDLGKTVVMKWNVNPGIKMRLEGCDIEEVEKFVYFGATVTTTGGAGKDLSARLGKAQGVLQLKEHLEEQSNQHKHQAEDF